MTDGITDEIVRSLTVVRHQLKTASGEKRDKLEELTDYYLASALHKVEWNMV